MSSLLAADFVTLPAADAVTLPPLPTTGFTIRFQVRFDDFDNPYPMCITTENNALQCHGLGRIYGSDQGCLCFYIHTESQSGPHGRGIMGTPHGRSRNEGWVKSKPLETGKWYTIELIKRSRRLAISVDNVISSSCDIPDHMSTADFIMKEPGDTIIAGHPQLSSNMDTNLHGEVQNVFVILDLDSEMETDGNFVLT